MPDPTQSVVDAMAEVRERTGPPPEPTPEQKALCDDGECGGCTICYGPGVPVFGPGTVIALADEVDRLSALLAGEGTPHRPPWVSDDATGSTLLLGVWFPNCPPDTDPEIVADCVAVIVNEERDRNGGTEGAVEVAGIPAPQWLTSETLANLKRAASGEGTAPPPDLVQVGWLRTDGAPTGRGPFYVLDDDPDCHAQDVADERLVPVYRLADRGTAPQVPAEVEWQGVTEPLAQYADDNVLAGLSRLTLDLTIPPGTRVRVVAADGAPPEETET